MPEPPQFDELIEQLRARVAQRRAEGLYPPDLEEELDGHFRHLALDARPPNASLLLDDLGPVRTELETYRFDRDRISVESRAPGGTAAHKAIAKAVSRQIDGVLAQVEENALIVRQAVGLLMDITECLADTHDRDVVQQFDDLLIRFNEQQRTLHTLAQRLDAVAERVVGADANWYVPASAADTQDLAARFAGHAPVLEVGSGAGALLPQLVQAGIEARGVDHAEGADVLRGLDDDTLGGLALVLAVERLTPPQLVDILHAAGEKVRPGGVVVFEAPNPASLGAHAQTLWSDPRAGAPVRAEFVEYASVQAGFTTIERIDRDLVPPDQGLELVSGDDEATKQLNANFERINALLFAPQRYVIVARR